MLQLRRADGRNHAGLAQRDECNRQPGWRDSRRWPGDKSTAAAEPEPHQVTHSVKAALARLDINGDGAISADVVSERTRTSARCSGCTDPVTSLGLRGRAVSDIERRVCSFLRNCAWNSDLTTSNKQHQYLTHSLSIYFEQQQLPTITAPIILKFVQQ